MIEVLIALSKVNMCGRFSFSFTERIIEERFGISIYPHEFKACYNCAPSQNLAVISNENPSILSYYRWGLIPFWAKDKTIGNKMINAKAETILEKPSFKNAFKNRRCLVLADSFYEWKNSVEKIPYRILMKDESPFAMAGIWDKWQDSEGNDIYSFAIITTQANEIMTKLHHRMPVIIRKDEEINWLTFSDIDYHKNILCKYNSDEMKFYPISKLVNSPANDIAEVHQKQDQL